MIAKTINIEQLEDALKNSFEGDSELLDYYDKGESIDSVDDAVKNIFNKIDSIKNTIEIKGVFANDKIIGYIVYLPSYLISFGLNKKFRNKIGLSTFWDMIKDCAGEDFECSLYDYNTRAIEWLKRCGMKTIFKNVTTLQLCQ